MLRLLEQQNPALAGIVIALILIFWPPPKRREEEEKRQARLAELEDGAEEAFFEEERALRAYGPNSAGPFRFWGVLLLLLSGSMLFL